MAIALGNGGQAVAFLALLILQPSFPERWRSLPITTAFAEAVRSFRSCLLIILAKLSAED